MLITNICSFILFYLQKSWHNHAAMLQQSFPPFFPPCVFKVSVLFWSHHHIPGGYSHQNCKWMCLLDLENLTFSILIFCPISQPSVGPIPFLKEKHPILTKLGACYNNLPKYPNLCNLGSSVSDETPPPITIPNFAKERPKR